MILLIGIIFTACSNKQITIKTEIKKEIIIQKPIDNYEKALSYEGENGFIKGDNYTNYRHYLDKSIKEKNPEAYLKAYQDYKNPIGKKAYIKDEYKIVAKQNRQKAAKFALLAIENQTNQDVSCDTLKQVDEQNMFNEEQSYKIYLANIQQGCINLEDENFDFQFTPSISFINKAVNGSVYEEERIKVLKELVDNYAKKAINGTLSTKYKNYDDRWIMLSKSARNLAFISYKNGDKASAGTYLALAKKIIESTPLNKNRYYEYNLNKKDVKKYYHKEARNKIIKTGSDEVLTMLLKMI